MAQERVFVEGMRSFDKSAKAPDFVICEMVTSVDEFEKFIKENAELITDFNGVRQLKWTVLRGRTGGLYTQVNTFKPDPSYKNSNQNTGAQDVPTPDPVQYTGSDDLPF